MRLMYKLCICLLILTLFPGLVPAQDVETGQTEIEISDPEELEKTLNNWRKQYVRHIITDQEKAEWGKLQTLEEKLRFIEFFWELRDPTPATPENEYREDYQKRWQYVNQHFTAGKPGWRTDRGRIYLMIGEPDSVERNVFGRNRSENPSEIWYYNSLPNQELKAQVKISFVDFLGYGDYEIVGSVDNTAIVNSRFGIATNALHAYALRRTGEVNPIEEGPEDIISTMWDEARIRQPELLSRQIFDLNDELREVANVPKLLVREAREKVRTEIARGDLTFDLSTSAFRQEDGKAYVPITLSVPLERVSYKEDSSGRVYDLNVYARIRNNDYFDSYEDDLQILLKPEEEAQPTAEEPLNYLFQFSFSVPPGDYELNVTLRDTLAKNVGHKEQNVDVPEYSSRLSLSNIILADSISDASGTQFAGDSEVRPFQFANRRVIPNVDRRVPMDQKQFHLYFHVYNYQLSTETGASNLEVQYFLYRDGAIFSKTPPSLLVTQATNNAYVESAFPTASLGVGVYRFEAVVTDKVTGERATGEVSFRITAPDFRVSDSQ